MAKLIAPHGTIVDVTGVEAVRLRRAGWKPVPTETVKVDVAALDEEDD